MDFAVSKCVELIFESEMNFKNIDVNELGLYLAITMDRAILESEQIIDFCPSRIRKGKRHTITASGCSKDKSKRWKGWVISERITDDTMKKKMISIAVGVALKVVLSNHIFVFNKLYYRQKKGGAIGVGVAGDVANVFMIWWDRELKRRLEANNIILKLYSRYVDDGNIVLKKIIANEGKNQEEETLNKLKGIANDIHPSIQVKIDYPSNHDNNRLPVLDTEQWMEDVIVNGVCRTQILHTHYEKAISNKTVVHRESAISFVSKINILTADLVRINRNISSFCVRGEREGKMQYFMKKLQHSGYSKKERITVYRKAKGIYDKMCENASRDIYPMYRGKFWKQKERQIEKSEKKKNWYSKGGYQTVLFVDATPKQKMAKEIQKVLKECNLKIKVIEKSGDSLKNKLVRSNPFPSEKCEGIGCKVCASGQSINCKLREFIYEIGCSSAYSDINPCDGIYKGESSRSTGERLGEHLEEYSERKTKSVFHKHMVESHAGERKDIVMKIIGHCPNDAMLRQVTEAVIIRETKPGLNKKEEWGNMNISKQRYTGKR